MAMPASSPNLPAIGRRCCNALKGWQASSSLLSAAEGHEATQRRGRRAKAPGVDLNALRVAARAKAPAGAAYLVDEARCATLDLLGDSKAAAAIVEQRLRGMDR